MELSDITFGKGSNFTWGEAIKRHDIGEYSVIEFYPHEYINCCSPGRMNYDKTSFVCFIKGKSIGRGTDSLDSALATCIAYKHGDPVAASYFMRMIKEVS